jgi:hypothetical protein
MARTDVAVNENYESNEGVIAMTVTWIIHSRKYREQILETAGPEDAHKIFEGNAARVYGFDESRLSVAV